MKNSIPLLTLLATSVASAQFSTISVELPGFGTTTYRHLTILNKNLVLTVSRGALDELWLFDGDSLVATRLLSEGPDGAGDVPTQLTPIGDQIFFVADGGGLVSNFNVRGRELWATDGTPAGTRFVANINGNAVDSFISELAPFGDLCVFSATGGTNSGFEVWFSDGTTLGTRSLGQIAPGGAHSYPREFTEMGGELFFTAENTDIQRQLFYSSGTAAGSGVQAFTANRESSFINDFHYPKNLTIHRGELYFAAQGDTVLGRELWRSNQLGTIVNRVSLLNAGQGSEPEELTSCGPLLYFSAIRSDWGRELIYYRPETNAITTTEIRPGSLGSDPLDLTSSGNLVFFSADDGSRGRELWVADHNGDVRLLELAEGSLSSNPRNLISSPNGIFFDAWTPTKGRQIYHSDGTLTGTRCLTTLPLGALPTELTTVRDGLFFVNQPSGVDETFHHLKLSVPLPQNIGLTISRSGNNLILKWPASDTRQLEWSNNLGQSNWRSVGEQPEVIGGQKTIKVSSASGKRFFRLRQF